MCHLGVVLYEYLGEEYPEVLGSILGGLKVGGSKVWWEGQVCSSVWWEGQVCSSVWWEGQVCSSVWWEGQVRSPVWWEGLEVCTAVVCVVPSVQAVVNVVGMTRMQPPIKDLLPRLTPILKNRRVHTPSALLQSALLVQHHCLACSCTQDLMQSLVTVAWELAGQRAGPSCHHCQQRC